MNRRWTKALITCATMGCVAASYAGGDFDEPSVTAKSLPEVVNQVIHVNPVIQSREAFVEVNYYAIDEQRATYFPSVDINTGFGYEWSNNSTTRQKFGGNSKYDELDRQEGSLIVTQRLFDGFETIFRTRAAKSRHASSQNQLFDGGEIIGLQGVEVFLDVMRQRELVAIAESSVRAHKDIAGGIEKRESAGYDRRADVFQASSRLSLASTRLETQKGDLDEAVSRYRELVYEAAPELMLPAFDESLIPLKPEDAIEIAMETNPAVKAAADNTKATKKDIVVVTSPFYPLVNLELSASQNENLDGVEGQNDDFQAFVRVRYNLYRGGADLARRKQAIATHQQAIADEAEVRRQTRENIRRSYAAIKEAKSQIQQEIEHVKSAKELVQSYKSQFEIGTRSLLALLDAEDERFIAEANLKNQEFILLFEQYRLLANMGHLLTNLGIDFPVNRSGNEEIIIGTEGEAVES